MEWGGWGHGGEGKAQSDGVDTGFGKSIEGLDIIDDIRAGDTMDKVEILS